MAKSQTDRYTNFRITSELPSARSADEVCIRCGCSNGSLQWTMCLYMQETLLVLNAFEFVLCFGLFLSLVRLQSPIRGERW